MKSPDVCINTDAPHVLRRRDPAPRPAMLCRPPPDLISRRRFMALSWAGARARFASLRIRSYAYISSTERLLHSQDDKDVDLDIPVFCHNPHPDHGGGSPVSAPVPKPAEAQQQEVAELVRQLHDANARIQALEAAAGEQLCTHTQTITALQNELLALQDCVAAREEENDKVNDTLRVLHRELDQNIRQSTADIKVRLASFPPIYTPSSPHDMFLLLQRLRASRVCIVNTS